MESGQSSTIRAHRLQGKQPSPLPHVMTWRQNLRTFKRFVVPATTKKLSITCFTVSTASTIDPSDECRKGGDVEKCEILDSNCSVRMYSYYYCDIYNWKRLLRTVGISNSISLKGSMSSCWTTKSLGFSNARRSVLPWYFQCRCLQNNYVNTRNSKCVLTDCTLLYIKSNTSKIDRNWMLRV
jgi:hypothetical protein